MSDYISVLLIGGFYRLEHVQILFIDKRVRIPIDLNWYQCFSVSIALYRYLGNYLPTHNFHLTCINT